jgi:large subunit ribosomal protein L23|tara:strand:- start:33 stop:320 length:288 start_codon:yes stop_codon:yes gene_type:complete
VEAHRVLIRPIITEQVTALTERFNQVAFQVEAACNKFQIRDAVEALYGVKVEKVATMNMPGKTKRRGTSIGKRPDWKKAIVTLKEGDTIDFFATE